MIDNVIIDNGLQKPQEKGKGYDWSISDYDYLLSGELTVTITLSEYRRLLIDNANAKVNEANHKRYEAERALSETKKELEDVKKKQIAELRSMFSSAAMEAASKKKEEDE